ARCCAAGPMKMSLPVMASYTCSVRARFPGPAGPVGPAAHRAIPSPVGPCRSAISASTASTRRSPPGTSCGRLTAPATIGAQAARPLLGPGRRLLDGDGLYLLQQRRAVELLQRLDQAVQAGPRLYGEVELGVDRPLARDAGGALEVHVLGDDGGRREAALPQ